MMCSIRIVTVDHYMSKPENGYDPLYSHFRSNAIKEVPVIRIFGVTQSGEKACAHIHRAFPYICIPMTNKESGASFTYNMAESLDNALNSSFGGGSRQQHVYNISVISAIPFYGFHSSKQQFLKIEFYRPSVIKRAVQVLQAGTIYNEKFQPHEAHLSYVLQFFIDYNLYGMSFLNLSEVTFRVKLDTESSCEAQRNTTLNKTTCCPVEVDAIADNILNRLEEANGNSLNPGLSSIREEEQRRRLEDGLDQNSLSLSDCRTFKPTKSDLQFRNQFVKAVKMRRDNGDSCSQVSSQETQLVTFDNEDMSVLKVLFNRIVAADDMPDEDSILGSWSPDQEDNGEELDNKVEDHGQVEEDLSQPFVSFIEISDSEEEVIPSNEVHTTLARSDSDTSVEWQPQFLDGNADEPTKEGSSGKRQRGVAVKAQAARYRPLNVRLHKSPRKNEVKKKISSPEIFQVLQRNSSELRKIRSPISNRTKLDLTDSNSVLLTSNKCPGYEGRKTRSRSRHNFLKMGNLNPDIQTSVMSVKKVLFEENDTLNRPQASIIDADNGAMGTGNPPGMLVEDAALAPANHSSEESRGHAMFNFSDSEPISLSDEAAGETILSDNSSAISASVKSASPMPSTSERTEMAFQQTRDSCYQNYDSDDSCAALQWRDINATQNSIASFYGDTTQPVLMDCGYRVLAPAIDPPSALELEETMVDYGLNKAKPIEPFYSDPCDGSSSKEVGFSLITLRGRRPADLEEFVSDFSGELERHIKNPGRQPSRRPVILQPAIDPPSPDQIAHMFKDKCESLVSSINPLTPEEESSSEQFFLKNSSQKLRNKHLTQVERRKRQSGEIELATPNNSGQFKMDFQNLQEAHMSNLYRFTTLMVLEVHAGTRGELCPDPEHDAIQAAFYLVMNDVPPDSELPSREIGAIVVSNTVFYETLYNCHVITVSSEEQLFQSLLDLVSHHDPDIIAGYEIEMQSWGYLIQRGYSLGLNLLTDLSRVVNKPNQSSSQTSRQQQQNDYDLKLSGRIVLNVWRLMRHEVALMSYSFENVSYHVLHTRVPKFSYKTLTHWWNHFSNKYRHLVMKHYLTMVDGTERLLDQLDLIRRTSELASLFGIQFYEVFSRGSQFRVESMMLRLAKRLGYISVSPSMEQRAQMMAPQSLPLIMEPESRFYGEPVIVLDFQSLYPSMMIAYNYCFSTCLGRLADLVESDEIKFGCTSLKTNLKELLKLQNNIHVSPSGIVFVDKSIRKGVVPLMLEEILETRLMVKASMKRHKDKKLLTRALDARQLGLKLIANVTYGYTSANFSGRMPCIEVGDSVVSKGRETLERAIRLVENTEKWKARVVYGDTDSLFVLCPGRSKEEAFVIGQQIAEQVSNDNPPPVKLKLEKVFQPCILQTKKRYVGYMYESADQETPVYLAKGIETVRRDGCPAASKILEKSLKLLFDNGDVSAVRQYVRQQLVKVLSGRLSPAELSFAREYRGISGYHPTAPVPALKIARELMAVDRRAEPRRSERVPYVVVCGPPGLPLISLIRHLPAYLADHSRLVLNADYYITKAILPPLDRCLSLLGADVFSWYASLPKKQLFHGQHLKAVGEVRKATIAQYFATVNCVVCSRIATPSGLCEHCQANPQTAIALLSCNLQNLERKTVMFNKICQSCCSRSYEIDCVSLDCPVLFRRIQATHDRMQTVPLRQILDTLISEIT